MNDFYDLEPHGLSWLGLVDDPLPAHPFVRPRLLKLFFFDHASFELVSSLRDCCTSDVGAPWRTKGKLHFNQQYFICNICLRALL